MNSSEILNFWFGDDYFNRRKLGNFDIDYFESKFPKWFGRASEDFEKVQFDNAVLLERLEYRELVHGNADLATELLARIILFDQFSRTIYRGEEKAFQYDAIALNFVQQILDERIFFTHYSPIERLFIIMPMSHSEDIKWQELNVKYGNEIAIDQPIEIQTFFRELKGFPNEHYDVIKRFSRFPSRNFALGREMTQEELDWLQSPDCPAWARSQMLK